MPLRQDTLGWWRYNRVFIETGAFHGDGIQYALDVGFEKIVSIELGLESFEEVEARFHGNPRVEVIWGDSAHWLPLVLAEIDEPATIWLDAHSDIYSPVLEELEAIGKHRKDHTILIDDRRRMNGHWENVNEEQIRAGLMKVNPEYKIMLQDGEYFYKGSGRIDFFGDIVVAVPPGRVPEVSDLPHLSLQQPECDFAGGGPILDKDMLRVEFAIGGGPHHDGAMAHFTTPPMPDMQWNRMIMAMTEPPASNAYLDFYEYPQKFLAAFHFGPKYMMAYKNCAPITTDPIVFPYYPLTHRDRRREPIRLRPPEERKVMFHGYRRPSYDVGDCFERTNLYQLRCEIIEYLMSKMGEDRMIARGPGWGSNTRFVPDWRKAKLDEIDEADPDFVLCCENSIFENYVTEKIHDGFSSDRVVLYLGEANIEKWVPKECFVNLGRYYDKFTGDFDTRALYTRITTMTEEEYRGIILAAREWWATAKLDERAKTQCQRLTKLAIDAARSRAWLGAGPTGSTPPCG